MYLAETLLGEYSRSSTLYRIGNTIELASLSASPYLSNGRQFRQMLLL